MTDISNPTDINPTRVERRVDRLNKRRETDFPLWATAGEKVLTQVAGPQRVADEVEEELRAAAHAYEMRRSAFLVGMGYKAYRYREMIRPYFTASAFASLDRKRRIYPLDPVYASEYWGGLVKELLGQGEDHG
jgi:hypothetical protein